MKLILCGGGSGDQNTLANQKLNEIIDHNKPILYIPLAIDTKGFDILSGISIFPHYTNRKSKYTEEENNERMKMFTDSITKYSKEIGEVIAIPEEDAIYISEEGVQVIGTKQYFVFKNGVSEKINLFDCEQRLNKKL